ncbi:MAG: tRNA (guanine-N(1)-)-methyltransferase [Candidatus Giovannonibacteria bacterium GW2011_GWA1_43_15]|uniref:tRNA (guanine-N(1)-)-methyltransferase n=1 Tax=Candidatus Giovannonibacteria bacterium RIFCSPLOWO2_12_FULL_43_26 TaxID=1798363 RepID=A0A1F5XWV8_9BACT|nr:MAG: tRNA (guanine-N(1)-)-methyltransferase [Candidatus Giovannonibacteria bacterium GW2011_GWA1_43_15]OGF92392.1 MAG: tRNA (guanosine(37)-N1)-methyltransferase TrmD [Candidatus Giovannonibacteria bacterium RIFCSPLOWO2_12_FULL_43_26]
MRFDIITIFPKIFDSYFNESIIKRAREKKLIDIKIWDLRDFTKDTHHKVDDKPFGGGPGMVMKIEPLSRVLKKVSLGGSAAKLVILLDAGGKQFDSKMASAWPKKYNHIILIAGRYEGVDERIKNVVKTYGLQLMAVSIGPYVLTGGEIAAMAVVDAMARHIPGVLGKSKSLEEKRYGIGVPVYTRPEVFSVRGSAFGGKNKKYKVPKILLSGDHKKIENWRIKHKNA